MTSCSRHHFIENTRRLMSARGLNTASLSKRARIAQSAVWYALNDERRQVRLDTVDAIARALSVTTAELITDPRTFQ